MTKELMQLEVDSDLKKAFLACVSRAYNGKVEEGILDLMRIYVERANGTPGQKMLSLIHIFRKATGKAIINGLKFIVYVIRVSNRQTTHFYR